MTPAMTSEPAPELKERLKKTWMSGDYDRFSRHMEKDARRFFERLEVGAGTVLLDAACGSGQLALMAARAGADVTGCDIAANWIEAARRRAAADGLQARFDEADVEDMPYADASFDVVTSLIGAMFAPNPHRTAAELTRVCRPGGVIAMANWTPLGFIGQMFKTIARHIAPMGMPSPVMWGDEPTVRQRFGDRVLSLTCTLHHYVFEYPFGPRDVVEFFREYYGPTQRAFAALEDDGQQELRRELTSLWTAHNQAGPGQTKVLAEYLEVIAVRA